MERAEGSTYEEKMQSPTKRKEQYEENIVKKRETEEEDKAFYDHKLKQGGTIPLSQ